MSTDRELAAEWWEKHSNYRSAEDYARRIREDDATGLGHGQMAAMIRKGVMRANAMGLTLPEGDEKPKGKRKATPGKVKAPTPSD